jgi:protein TonB
MKREEKFRLLTTISMTGVILTAVILFVMLAACGNTTTTGTPKDEAATPQKSSVTRAADSVYKEVDEMPVFPEGDNGLLKFIAENTRYPEDAKKNGVTGKVIVKFVIGKDCSVSNVAIVKGVDPSLDSEAVRVVSSLPKFEKPAKKNGETVSVQFMVPITFALK